MRVDRDSNRRRLAAAVAVAASCIALAACSQGATPTPATSSTIAAETPPNADANHAACLYISDEALPDAVDFFDDYTVARESADPSQLEEIVTRFGMASDSASGDLATHLEGGLVELEAIQTRYNNDDPINPDVDYQALADSLIAIMDTCIDTLKG